MTLSISTISDGSRKLYTVLLSERTRVIVAGLTADEIGWKTNQRHRRPCKLHWVTACEEHAIARCRSAGDMCWRRPQWRHHTPPTGSLSEPGWRRVDSKHTPCPLYSSVLPYYTNNNNWWSGNIIILPEATWYFPVLQHHQITHTVSSKFSSRSCWQTSHHARYLPFTLFGEMNIYEQFNYTICYCTSLPKSRKFDRLAYAKINTNETDITNTIGLII